MAAFKLMARQYEGRSPFRALMLRPLRDSPCEREWRGVMTPALVQTKAKVEPDAASFGLLLAAALAGADPQLCLNAVQQMAAAGCPPPLLDFNRVLAVCVERKTTDAAQRVFKLLAGCPGVQPDEQSFGALINCAWVCADMELAASALVDMVAADFTPSVAAVSALLATLSS